MKKFLKVLSLLLVGLPFITYRSAQAQSLDTLFVDAPTTLFPVVDKAARLDLIDLYNHGIAAKVENISVSVNPEAADDLEEESEEKEETAKAAEPEKETATIEEDTI